MSSVNENKKNITPADIREIIELAKEQFDPDEYALAQFEEILQLASRDENYREKFLKSLQNKDYLRNLLDKTKSSNNHSGQPFITQKTLQDQQKAQERLNNEQKVQSQAIVVPTTTPKPK